ncbi:MAG: FAD-dependent oxidoreductase, partial [Planctomycetota bacterium]
MRVAVVGSGVAGMVTARRLHDAGHPVTLYEARARIGGHTATVDVDVDGVPVAVDTGFIVFNERTYPGFCALVEELGVEYRASNMSFSARVDGPGVEYCGGAELSGLLAQKRNALRPSYWSMLRGILRFYREAPALLEDGADERISLGDYLVRGGYSKAFV